MSTSEAESLNHRIRNLATRNGVPAIRMRNRIAFQRMLARLAHERVWVLKGGFSLEIRLGLSTRATKDLDLLRVGAAPTSAFELQDSLGEALEHDPGDGFTFHVRLPKPVRAEEAEPSTWRAVVDVRYAGTEFGTIAVDIVPQMDGGGTDIELLRIDSTLVGEPFLVHAIDVHRHVAEKFHAISRLYAHDRPSSRVKDLVDIVLLADSDLVLSGRLSTALRTVFLERRTVLPARLPEPPGDWARTYTALAVEAGTGVTDVHEAWRVAADMYERALVERAV